MSFLQRAELTTYDKWSKCLQSIYKARITFIKYTKAKDKVFRITPIFCAELDFYYFVWNLNTISESETIKWELSSNPFP